MTKKPGGPQDLASIRTALRRARQATEAEAARAAEEAVRLRREQNLFAATVGTVQPVRAAARAQTAPPLPRPVPAQRQRDERAVLQEALSDGFDAESLLETDEALSYRRPGIGPDVVRQLRKGRWSIQAQLDLHGARREEARERLVEFLRDASQRGLRCVRVVHGKGNGSPGREPVLKARVRNWLVQKSEVLAFVQARPSEGGAGALVVLLSVASRT